MTIFPLRRVAPRKQHLNCVPIVGCSVEHLPDFPPHEGLPRGEYMVMFSP